MVAYFAYGSNMDRMQMADRCPDSVVVGPATLPDHAFRIATGGYATVVPSPSDAVHGVLWHLPETDEASLDAYEDLASDFYRKIECEVTDGDGVRRPAMLYVASDPTPGRPVPGYQEKVVAAAIEHGFPAPYVGQLSGWIPPR